MQQEDAILEIDNVSYTYEGETEPVWAGLSCKFYKSKLNAICGPSGCGKSSLLYLIDGLIPHYYPGAFKGSVKYKGEDITLKKAFERAADIGFVMQNPDNQFVAFTVEDEIAFGLENLCVEPAEIKVRIQDALEAVGMQGFENKDLNDLSGGQKQKIAIACVLATKPEVLLLDEPTANLDPVAAREIFNLMLLP